MLARDNPESDEGNPALSAITTASSSLPAEPQQTDITVGFESVWMSISNEIEIDNDGYAWFMFRPSSTNRNRKLLYYHQNLVLSVCHLSFVFPRNEYGKKNSGKNPWLVGR